jgi:hypothetical protein
MNQEESKKYLEKNGLIRYFKGGKKGAFEPVYCDLAYLHHLAISRKVFTVLEFGIGWSTIVLADALRKNEEKWNRSGIKDDFRVRSPFKIFSIDSSRSWIANMNVIIPPELKKYIKISFSSVKAGLFNGRICHFYQNIPDIVPDLVYIDGPDPADVSGKINGLSWKNPERTVMSGDILLMESTFLPRTIVAIDERNNNARFLEKNLQRNWEIDYGKEGDIITMELLEAPLGSINRKKIHYCLGNKGLEVKKYD